MSRGSNAEIAARLFHELCDAHHYDAATCWKAIAELLLTCDVWSSPDGWRRFHGVVVYRESNDFRVAGGAVRRRAERLSAYLADQLGCSREQLCERISRYWREPAVRDLQPNNLVGHAFRSMIVEALRRFGAPHVVYEEEVRPADLFPGRAFTTRSKKAAIDVVARVNGGVAALISARWRFRHDRVDVPDEALSYVPAARHTSPAARFYAVLGEFSPPRLEKVLAHCAPAHPNPAIDGAVHFAPLLLHEGLGENGRTSELKDLAWLIGESARW